ncbi:hypothetical protein B0H34DRAFT_10809 [Crassisporium funariophilum]|nr:hypothetical protein B0H34DRAFT_10809 [Crassisporium funariophilum]
MEMTTPAPSSGIQQLPDEILLHIFDGPEIPLETLYNISQVSSRLHLLCLPLFFARFGTFEPSQFSEIIFQIDSTQNLDLLSGLRLALYVPSVKSLVCRFQLEGEAGDVYVAIRHLRRLRYLLEKLSNVEELSIYFENEACCCCEGLLPGETIDEPLESWSSTMGEMLDELLHKGCKSLYVQGGKFMVHTYSFKYGSKVVEKDRFASIKKVFGRGKLGNETEPSQDYVDVLNREKWRFQRTPGRGTAVILTPISASARQKSTLRSLTIKSMLFLVPPILHWTISALRYMHIQSLTLRKLSIHRKCWPTIFTLVGEAIPHLSELHLSCLRQVQPSDLLRFLRCLPSLTSLNLGHDIDSIDSFDLGPFPDFPRLITLSAPACWVLKLLSAQRTGLACLESLTILYKMRNDGLSHWLRRASSTSIPILLKEQRRPLTLSLHISLGSTPGWRMNEDINFARNLEGPGHTDDVTSLILAMDHQPKDADVPLANVLPRWLVLFSGLRHLSVNTHPRATFGSNAMLLMNQLAREGGLAGISNVDVNGIEVSELLT